MGRQTDCVSKGPTTVGGIEATIVAGVVEAITAVRALAIAALVQPTAGRAVGEVTIAAAAGGMMFAM
jgi:formyltetrahydrofolate synthetase